MKACPQQHLGRIIAPAGRDNATNDVRAHVREIDQVDDGGVSCCRSGPRQAALQRSRNAVLPGNRRHDRDVCGGEEIHHLISCGADHDGDLGAPADSEYVD